MFLFKVVEWCRIVILNKSADLNRHGGCGVRATCECADDYQHSNGHGAGECV